MARLQSHGSPPASGVRKTSPSLTTEARLAERGELRKWRSSRGSPHKQLGRSFVDLVRGIYYRLPPQGRRETNKRQSPVPIAPRLLAHLRRWHAKKIARQFFVEWQGESIKSFKTAFNSAVRLSGLDGPISPHTLRHTAARWLMQAGVDKWEAAGYLAMSVETLDRVYGHHHPDHLKTAARAIGYRVFPHQ